MARAGDPGFKLACAGRFFVALPASLDLSFLAKYLLSEAIIAPNPEEPGWGRSRKIESSKDRGAGAPQEWAAC
jgi:hypothetical protein